MKKILKLIGIMGFLTIAHVSWGMQTNIMLRVALLKTLEGILQKANEGSIGACLAIEDIRIALVRHGDINFQPFEVKDGPSKDVLIKHDFLTESYFCPRILDELKIMKIDSDKGIGRLMSGIAEKGNDPSKISMEVIDLIQSFKISLPLS